MRKFIPISTFKTLYSKQSDLLSEEGMNTFQNALKNEGLVVAQQHGYSVEDFIAFQETLLMPSSIVFYGWIEQNSVLTNALLGKIHSLYVDREKHLEHSLSTNFQRFLSPVLSEGLLNAQAENDAERKNLFSFVQLLDEKHRAVVEQQLFKPIQERLKELHNQSNPKQQEQELVELTQPLCSDEVIASVNYLSRASYALKLDYIDKILGVIRTKACTVRLANWLLERMESVELNQEHEYKITDLRKDLRRGDLRVHNHKRGRVPIRWRVIFTSLFVVALIGFVGYVIYFKPFSEVEEPLVSNNTSFREFTKEERIRMDSLLQEMDHPFEEIDTLDPIMSQVQTGVDLVLRKAFKSELMEAIYEDLMRDAELKENYPKNDCKTESSFSRRTEVQKYKV